MFRRHADQKRIRELETAISDLDRQIEAVEAPPPPPPPYRPQYDWKANVDGAVVLEGKVRIPIPGAYASSAYSPHLTRILRP